MASVDYLRIVNSVVERYKHLGDRTLSNGARQVGRAPSIAPEAWLHQVYAPADPALIAEDEREAGLRFPAEYRDLLSQFNGCELFVTTLTMHGIRRKFSRTGVRSVQPFGLPATISDARARGAPKDLFVFGGYSFDGSRLGVTGASPQVVRWNRENWKPLNRWENLEAFLRAEVTRLPLLFDEFGLKKKANQATTP